MNRLLRLCGGLFLCVGIVACDYGPKSASGFRLPDGDAGVGQDTFVRLQCTACHTVANLELEKGDGPVSVELGGRVQRIQTYGDLVTSIINPSHRLTRKHPASEVASDGESLMRNYNSVMTVQELVDLVAFLQGSYKVVPPPGGRYPPYSYEP